MTYCQSDERLIDLLVLQTDISLSFDEQGNPVWRNADPLPDSISINVWAGQRRDKRGDHAILEILRKNPTAEIQCCARADCNGTLPYLELHAKEKLTLIEQITYLAGMLWLTVPEGNGIPLQLVYVSGQKNP